MLNTLFAQNSKDSQYRYLFHVPFNILKSVDQHHINLFHVYVRKPKMWKDKAKLCRSIIGLI